MSFLTANVVFAFLCNLICIRYNCIIERSVIQQLKNHKYFCSFLCLIFQSLDIGLLYHKSQNQAINMPKRIFRKKSPKAKLKFNLFVALNVDWLILSLWCYGMFPFASPECSVLILPRFARQSVGILFKILRYSLCIICARIGKTKTSFFFFLCFAW